MSDFFAIRNVDPKTKEFITEYAKEKDLSMSEALREIVFLAKEHIKEQKPSKKKYRGFFDTYEKIAFKSGNPNLSSGIDKLLYEEKQ